MKLRHSPATETFIRTYGAALPHALLLTGSHGVGLATLAKQLASSNGSLLRLVSPESKTSSSIAVITVDRVRELYVETRAKLSGKNFVIIDDADTMNTTAQNALLKLLEEPNESICFILTSHSPDKLLTTIRSRCQKFTVAQISDIESKRLLKALNVTDEVTEQRLLYVANGLPAELSRLASDTSDFKKLLERVQTAKRLIEGTTYQRLAACFSISSDRQEVVKILEISLLLLRRSASTASDSSVFETIDKIISASAAIRANGNIRLQLAKAMLQ